MTDAAILADRLKLEAAGLVYLFHIEMLNGGGNIRLKANNSVTWQGNLWQGTAIEASGFQMSSDEELARPRLRIINSEGVFGYYITNKLLEGSTVYRYRVMRSHLEANVNIFEREIWVISRVLTITDALIELELRRSYDMPNSITPARMFIPPEYPLVNLS